MIIEDLKIAIHQIFNNKIKTLFNVFLSFMLGSLTLFLLFVGISVKIDGYNVSKEYYYSEDKISISLLNLGTTSAIKYNDKYSVEIFDKLASYDDYYDDYIDEYYTNIGSMYNENLISRYPVYDVNHMSNKGLLKLKYSNIPSLGEYVYVNESYAKSNNLDKGDKITIKYESGIKNNKVEYVYDFTIADIHDMKTTFIFDKSIFNVKNDSDFFNNLYISGYINLKLNTKNDIDDTLKINRELVNYFNNTRNDELGIQTRGICEQLERFDNNNFIINLFFYADIVFAIISLFLSIGIIGNAISVLLDVNKKTLGLNKALGMKNKDVLYILMFEVLISILFGLILSIILVLSLNKFMELIIGRIMNVLLLPYGLVEEGRIYDVITPFYVPFIMIVLISIFILALSYKNIKKALYGNPIILIKKED